jgi:hypothetical protein
MIVRPLDVNTYFACSNQGEESEEEEEEEEEIPGGYRFGKTVVACIFRWGTKRWKAPEVDDDEEVEGLKVNAMMAEGASDEAIEESKMDKLEYAGFCCMDVRSREELIRRPFVPQVRQPFPLLCQT